MSRQLPIPGFRFAKFDLTRHEAFLIDAMAQSTRAGFPDFEPGVEYIERARGRIREVASGVRDDRLLILENEQANPVALLWLELRTYPADFDGIHEPEPWPELCGRRGAQLRNTWVSSDCRGRGLAKFLKCEAEEVAREMGAEFMYTRCAKTNEPIVALNRKLGYELITEDGPFLRLRKKLMPDAW